MSQQPPEWFRPNRGSRIGCADVTIVSIASIIAFVLLIFVVLRPDFARFIDITGSNNITVGAVRATETPGGPALTPSPDGTSGISGGLVSTTVPGTTVAATTGPTVTATSIATPAIPTPTVAPTPTVPPTPAFRTVKLLDTCRLRQDPSYNAAVIAVFQKGASFKVYDETRPGTDAAWQRVEPDDNSNRMGWMIVTCF